MSSTRVIYANKTLVEGGNYDARSQFTTTGLVAQGDTPVRANDSHVTYLVDGRQAMWTICRYCIKAQKYIYLANWGMTARMELVRGDDYLGGPDGSPQRTALWERTASIIGKHGYPVKMGKEIVSIQHDGKQVTGVISCDTKSNTTMEHGSRYISTLPMRELVYAFDPPLPAHIRQAADKLKYRDFLTIALIVDRAEMFPDNWIYLHDPDIVAGRIQNFKNWSPDMVPDASKTCLGLEYFCFEGDGLWTSSDEDLVKLGGKDLLKLKMCKPEEILGGFVVRQPKAYPVYDDEYKTHVRTIRDYLEAHAPNLQLVGRNGMHHYNNQDHSMMSALCAARNIAVNANLDPWSVNTDAEYHEGTRDVEDLSGRLVPQRAK